MASRKAVQTEPVDEIQALKERVKTLEYEDAAKTKRIAALEASRPGRKAKPLIALRQDGVCAVSPDIDSSTCPDSSIFRYQQGCHGVACKTKQHTAYERRKVAKSAAETPVAAPKRRSPEKVASEPAPKRAVTKKAGPVAKKGPAKKVGRQRLAAVG